MHNCVKVLCSPKKPRYMHYQVKTAGTNPLANLNDRPIDSQNLRPRPVSTTGPMYEELDQHHQSRNVPPQHTPHVPPSSSVPPAQFVDPNVSNNKLALLKRGGGLK